MLDKLLLQQLIELLTTRDRGFIKKIMIHLSWFLNINLFFLLFLRFHWFCSFKRCLLMNFHCLNWKV